MIDKIMDGGYEVVNFFKKLTFANKMFPIIALIFGLIIIKTVPPLQAPDEIGHFIKAYSFSENKIKPQSYAEKLKKTDSTWGNFGFEVPYVIKSMNSYSVDKNGKHAEYPYYYKGVDQPKIDKGEEAFIGTGGITNYYFANYIPQISAIKIGKALDKPIIWQYYAARYFNLIGYILIVFFALKRYPFSKLAASIFALNPMSLFLAASTSGDAMIIAVSFYFASWIFSMVKEERVSNLKMVISSILMVNLVLLKPTLIVLGLMFFLIPNKALNINRKAIWGIGIFVACILCYVLWNKMMIDQQLLYRDFANPSKQVELFFKDPSVFFENFKEHYLFGVKGDNIVYSFAGKFGLLDAPLGLHWLVLYFSMIPVACLAQDKDNGSLAVHKKIVVGIMLVVYTLLTFFALYQIWNKPGRTASIEGLQGRYFIPLSLLVPSLFSSKERMLNIKNGKINFMVTLCIVLILIATILTLSTRYPVA